MRCFAAAPLALLASSAVLLGSGAASAEPAPGSPEERVDRLFAEWDRADSPGCALGVVRDGAWLHRRGYGMADLEHGVPLTPTSVLRIGSTSKQFTAMAVLLLEHQGRLSLDDDVRKYLPELPDYGQPVRIADLLYHRSGLRHYLTLLEMQGLRPRDGATPAQALDLLARQQALNFRPGERYQSSDSNYFLLALIVERASGRSLREYAAEHIFEPLGMTRTHFHDDLTHLVRDRADGYSRLSAGEGFRLDMEHTVDVVGDGGLLTTVEDLFLWDQNFYANRLGGGRELIERFQRPGGNGRGEAWKHAAGVLVERYRGLPAVHYSGGWVGFVSYMIRFPSERFSVICLCNLSDVRPWHLARDVADIYLEEAFTEPKPRQQADPASFVELPAAELSRRVGFYEDANARALWRLSLEDGELVAEDAGTRYALRPVGPAEFHSVNTPYVVRFVFEDGPGGERSALRVEPLGLDYYLEPPLGGVSRLEALAPVSPSASQLEEYLGSYASDELGTRYRLVREGGSLYLRHEDPHRNPFASELVPIAPDRFRATPVQLRFLRDARGAVEAALLDDRHYVWSLRLTRLPQAPAASAGAAARPPAPGYAEKSARVDALFARYGEARGPGCAVGIVDGGRPVHRGAYGRANLDHDVPLAADSVFRIASVSKQFTALAVALLAEDGLLDLDDPVGHTLPEVHPELRGVTIRQLMDHTGGVPDYDGESWEGVLASSAGGPFRFGNEDYLTTEEFFQVTTRLRPLFPAGERFAYSNIGYFWMSLIVERVSGESLADFAARRIFGPAGMNSSFFNDDVNRVVPKRATGYKVLPDGSYEVFETNLAWLGDGGVYTSVDDFFLWDAQFQEPTIGADPEALRRRLVTPIGKEESYGPHRIRHALGLWVSAEDAEDPVIWHPGSWVGFKALYRRFPRRNFAYFVFCNRDDVDRMQLASEIEAIYAPD